MLTGLGFAAPTRFAWLVTIAEPGAPMPGAEIDIAPLAGLVALLLIGPGKASVDRVLGIEPGVVAEREPAPARR